MHYEASSPIQESNLISLRLVEREQAAVKLGIWRRSATKALRINMNERVSMSCDQWPLIYVFLVWKRLKVSLKSFLLVKRPLEVKQDTTTFSRNFSPQIHLFPYCVLNYGRHFRFREVPLKKKATNPFKECKSFQIKINRVLMNKA